MPVTLAPDEPLALSPEWQLWVAEQLLEGHGVDDVVPVLVAAGLEGARARAEVVAIAASPGVLAGLRRRPAGPPGPRGLALAARLHQRLARMGGGIERRPGLSAEDFYTSYYARNTPVLIPDFTAGWPALTRWGGRYFREAHGDAAVKVCVGRDQDPTPDPHFAKHTVEMRLADYVDRVEAAGVSNDLYMIANHRNTDGPLAGLLRDVAPPPDFVDTRRLKGNVSFWYGPAGTKTPLHHDTSNILFCQIVGRKKMTLVSPFEEGLSEAARGFYAPFDLDDPDHRSLPALSQARIIEVVLDPGDCLFLPVGWWHQVRALDPSVSISFIGFHRPNRFDDYKPGRSP